MQIKGIPNKIIDISPIQKKNKSARVEKKHRRNIVDKVDIFGGSKIFKASAYSVNDGVNRISEIKSKIKNGYYSAPEFLDKLADKLIESPKFLSDMKIGNE